jgi:hypothetical protein
VAVRIRQQPVADGNATVGSYTMALVDYGEFGSDYRRCPPTRFPAG